MKKDRSDRSFVFHAMAIQIKGSLFATNLLASFRNFMTHETEREDTYLAGLWKSTRKSKRGSGTGTRRG